MRLRYKIFAIVATLLAVFLMGRYYHRPLTNGEISVKLKPQDKEEILVNPLKHTITIVTDKGSKTETLPDTDSEIDIAKDDHVTIKASQFGFEARPFVFGGYSSHLRWGAGVDGLYFKKLDLGAGFAGGSGTNSVIFAQLSYNVYSNVRLGITMDHQEHVGVGISIRI